MKKLYLLVFIGLWTGCNDGYHIVKDSWQKENCFIPESHFTPFDEVNTIKNSLHGKKVKIIGRLIYDYDETAIFAINEFSDFKPVWIYLDANDTTLHNFLLKYDGALIKLTGILDTIPSYYDKYYYQCAVKDVISVATTKYKK